MPPMSGFLGKLLVLDAVRDSQSIALAWTTILTGSLLTIVGFARAGSILFWKSTATSAEANSPLQAEGAALMPAGPLAVAPVLFTVALLVVLSVFAGPVTGYLEGTAAQLFDPSSYVSTVLGPQGES